MRTNTPKLLQRNLFTIIVLFALVVIVTTVVSGLSLRTNLTNEFVNRGTDIADSIANTSIELMLNRNASTIQSKIDSFLDPETGVAYIFVVTDENEFISHTFVPEIPQEIRDIVVDETNQFAIQNLEIADKGEFINISAPILTGTLGEVHVGMDLGIISGRIQSVIFNQIVLVSLVFIVSVFIAYAQTVRISRPLLQLTEYVQLVTSKGVSSKELVQKETELQPVMQRNDEVGQLAQDFQKMVEEVRSYEQELEQRVADRTQDLNLSAEIGRQVTQAQNVDDVLVEATTLMKNQFDLYQVQIYLSDDAQENLILRASDGYAGSKILEAGHTLPINQNSLNGSAAYDKQVIIVKDAQENPSFRPHPLLPHTRSETAVPLMVGNNVVGVLDLQSDQPNTFTEERLPAFTTLAGQLAIAIQNASQVEQTISALAESDRQSTRLEKLNEMSAAISVAANLNEVYKVAGQYTQQIVGGLRASLGMLEPDGKTFEVLGLSGEKGAIPMGAHLPVSKTAVGLCIRENRLIIDSDGHPENYLDAQKLAKQGLTSSMNAPIVVNGKTIGALNIASDQANIFRSQEGTLMQQIASLLSSAIENATLFTELNEEQARTRAILESIGTPLVIVRVSDSTVVYGNEPLAQLFGMNHDKMIGQATPDFFNNPADRDVYIGALRESGKLSNHEVLLKHADGTPFWALMTGQITQFQGELVSITSFADITERHTAIEQMEENEELLRTIVDSTLDWIFITDTNHRYQMVNKSYADSMNLSPKDLIGKTALEVGVPEEIVKGNPEKGIVGFWPLDKDIMASGEIGIVDEEPSIVNGQPRILTTTRVPLKNMSGKVTGLVGYIHDITHIKEAEATMAKQATELQTVAELSTVLSTTLDTEQLLQDIVDRTKESFDLYHTHIYLLDDTNNTLNLAAGAGSVGTEMVAVGHNIPMDHEQSLVAQAAQTKTGVIVNNIAADPNFLPNPLLPNTKSELAVPIIVANKLLGVLDIQADKVDQFTDTDINIQTTLATQVAVALENARTFEQVRQQEEILRQRDAQLAQVNELAGIASFEFDLTTQMFIFNDQFYTTAGTTLDEIGSGEMSADDFLKTFVHPDDAQTLTHSIEDVFTQTSPDFIGYIEYRLIRVDGNLRNMQGEYSLSFNEQGQPIKVLGYTLDITEQRKAEAAQQALNTELEEQLERVNALQRAMTRESWQAFMTTTAGKRPFQGFEFNQDGIKTLTNQDLTDSKNKAIESSATNGGNEIISPVKIQDTTIGKIGVRNSDGTPISEEKRSLLISLTAQVAEALDRARLFEETELGRQEIEEQAAELSTVNEISELVSTQLNINDLLNAVGDRLIETFSANSVYIALVDEKTKAINFPYFTNVVDGPMNIAPRALDDQGGFTAKVYKTKKPVIHNPSYDDDLVATAVAEGAAVVDSSNDSNSYIGIPMTVGDTVIGVIGINGQQDRRMYHEEDIPLLTTLSSTIAVSLQNAQQFEDTQRRANREAMVNEISQKIQSAPTIESAMQTAVAELGKALNLKHAVVKLNKPNQ